MSYFSKILVPFVAPMLIVLLMGCTPTSSTPTLTPTPTSTAGQKNVSIDLVARNIAFNLSTITVPAGAAITVNFNNEDVGVPHNFAVYQNLPGGQTRPIFTGNVITGPAKTTYRFDAPSASESYFFECDIHPEMNGQFIVTPSQ